MRSRSLALALQFLDDEVHLVAEPVDARSARDARFGVTVQSSDRSSVSLPAIDISAGSGSSLPGSRMFQYIQRNISLPQWLISVSFSSENGPIPGSGYLPGQRLRRRS